jgi:methylated-DNA-protein-cysteine methyltransferase related protein
MKSNLKNTKYYDQVYDLTRLIPYGRVTTYGAIANFLTLGSARMVGWALNQCNLMDTDIPAHRVVNRKGYLSGSLHFKPAGRMEELLKAEGIQIKGSMVVEFERHFWNPIQLLQ